MPEESHRDRDIIDYRGPSKPWPDGRRRSRFSGADPLSLVSVALSAISVMLVGAGLSTTFGQAAFVNLAPLFAWCLAFPLSIAALSCALISWRSAARRTALMRWTLGAGITCFVLHIALALLAVLAA